MIIPAFLTAVIVSIAVLRGQCLDSVVMYVKQETGTTNYVHVNFSSDQFSLFYECLCKNKLQCRAIYSVEHTPNYLVTEVQVSEVPQMENNLSTKSDPFYQCTINQTVNSLICELETKRNDNSESNCSSIQFDGAPGVTCPAVEIIWSFDKESIASDGSNIRIENYNCSMKPSGAGRQNFTSPSDNTTSATVIGVTVAVVVIIGTFIAVIVWVWRRKRTKMTSPKPTTRNLPLSATSMSSTDPYSYIHGSSLANRNSSVAEDGYSRIDLDDSDAAILGVSKSSSGVHNSTYDIISSRSNQNQGSIESITQGNVINVNRNNERKAGFSDENQRDPNIAGEYSKLGQNKRVIRDTYNSLLDPAEAQSKSCKSNMIDDSTSCYSLAEPTSEGSPTSIEIVDVSSANDLSARDPNEYQLNLGQERHFENILYNGVGTNDIYNTQCDV